MKRRESTQGMVKWGEEGEEGAEIKGENGGGGEAKEGMRRKERGRNEGMRLCTVRGCRSEGEREYFVKR